MFIGIRRRDDERLHLTFALFSLAYAGVNITAILNFSRAFHAYWELDGVIHGHNFDLPAVVRSGIYQSAAPDFSDWSHRDSFEIHIGIFQPEFSYRIFTRACCGRWSQCEV